MSKLVKNSSIYTVVSVLQKAIGFFLLPLYTRYLMPADYGVVSVVTSIEAFLTAFYMLSLHGAVTRFYFSLRNDLGELKKLWGTCFSFVGINAIILTALLISFREYIFPFVAKGIPFFPNILIGLIIITLNPVYSIFQSALQARQDGVQFGINNFLFFICNLVLTILFVVGFRMGATGVLLAALVTNAVFYFYTLIVFIPTIKLGIHVPLLKKCLKYSLPLLPHSLSGWVMSMVDRVLLNNMKNAASAGLFNIGFQFANILNIITVAINQAYAPWFLDQMNSEQGKRKITQAAHVIVVFYSFIALGISFFSPEFMFLFLERSYLEGWVVIPILCFAYLFQGVYYVVCNALFLEKTYFVPSVTIIGAIINLVLNLALIPDYGIIGSAIATLVSNMLTAVVTFIVSNRLVKIEYKKMKLFGVPLLFFSIATVSFFYGSYHGFGLFAIKLLIYIGLTGFFVMKYRPFIGVVMGMMRRRMK